MSTTVTIPEAASRYLRGESDAWEKFCQVYLNEWFVWIAEELHAEVEQIRFSACADEFYELLFRPDLVRSVAESKVNEIAIGQIKGRCAVHLAHSNVSAVVRFDASDSLVEQFTGKISILDGDEEDIGIEDGFKYSVRALEIDRFKAGFGNIHLPRKLDKIKCQSVLSLNVVDIALYKTLLQHPDLLKTLDWRIFEKLLADILESFGYEVELQRGTKDGGIDIFALKKNQTFGIQRYLVQAKRWSNKVGVEPVQQLMFLHSHHKVTKSCLATTAAFTKGAWQLAEQYRWQLELRDFDGIQDWLNMAVSNRQK